MLILLQLFQIFSMLLTKGVLSSQKIVQLELFLEDYVEKHSERYINDSIFNVCFHVIVVAFSKVVQTR